MADHHIERAAQAIHDELSGKCGDPTSADEALDEALDSAGLLVTREHDAAVAAKALQDAAADLERRASDPALIESADRFSGYYAGVRSAMQREIQLLHERADRIERNATT